MTVSIRLATPQDSQSLHQLICSLAAFQGNASAVKATPESLRSQMESEHPPFECLLAENKFKMVGFALFFQSYSTWEGQPGIYLEDLYVDPQLRGEGVGRLLLSSLANLGKDRGCARIDWTVLKTNQSALGFYKNIEAEELDEWSHWRLNLAQRPYAISESAVA